MKDKSDPAEAFLGIRKLALTTAASDIRPRSGFDLNRVWGALMETGRESGVASLVAFVDGTTSLYLSSGGGVIGAGGHEKVRSASETFLAEAETMLPLLTRATETPLPQTGRVRFYVHAIDGLLTAEADEEDLGHGRHPLSRLFHAGHAVITPILSTTEERQTAGQPLSSRMWWQFWKR